MSASSEKYFVHETAVVDNPAEIGEGTKIWHFSHVMAGATIGSKCSIGQNVFIGTKVKIGNGVKIQNNVSVYDGVVIEDDVFCGPSCVFTNVIRPRSAFPRADRRFDQTLVKRGVTIGANATIVCGVTLGEQSFIGAGAVVTKDVPAYSLQAGNPARHKGWLCQCGEKLRVPTRGAKAVSCTTCGRRYRKEGNGITEAED